jgi:hypothetical protein
MLVLALVAVIGLAHAPLAAGAAATSAPSPVSSAVAVSKDAGTFEGTVTNVVYTAGSSSMTVKSGSQSTTFVVNPGTNVKGPSNDFTVDVKIGARVSVSASKSGAAYTAQIVRVISTKSAH